MKPCRPLCINVINDNAWSNVNNFHYVVSCICLGIFMIEYGNEQVIYSYCVELMDFKIA